MHQPESRQIVFAARNEVRIESGSAPRVESPTDIIISTRFSCVSAGTELAKLSGLQSFAFPNTLGNRAVGRVVAIGESVTHVKPGDLVFSHTPHSSRVRGAGLVCRLPEELDIPVSATVGMALVAMTGIRAAPPELGDVVVVVGLGLVGQYLCRFSKLSGATVLAIDPVETRTRVAASGGADRVAASIEEGVGVLADLTDGSGARVVYDCSGVPAVVEQVPRLAARSATVVLVGSPRGEYHGDLAPFLSHFHLWKEHSDLVLRGAHEWRTPVYDSPHVRHSMDRNCRIVAELMLSGTLDTDELVTRTYRPEEAAQAYSDLADGSSGLLGVVFDWTGSVQG